MDMNFGLYNIEEDIENILLYLNITSNERNIEKFIDGLYLKVENESILISKLEYIDYTYKLNINKNYLKEILNFSSLKSAFFEVRVNLVDSFEYFRIENYDFDTLVWKWDEYDFSLMYGDDGLKVLQGVGIELLEYEDVFGKIENVNELENTIAIKKIVPGSKENKLLEERMLKDDTVSQYSIRFVSRKTNTVIYELNEYKSTENELLFTIKSSGISTLKNFDYIYNVFFVVKSGSNEFCIRVRPYDNCDILPHLVCDDKKCFYIRQYKTKDNYISLIIRDYIPCMEISNINFNKDDIDITGSIKSYMESMNISVDDIYIKNSSDTKISGCIQFDIKEINRVNEFSIHINNESLFKQYSNDLFYVVLLVKICSKLYEYKLEFNSEDFIKEKSIFYPEINYKKDDQYIKLITSYKKNILTLQADNNVEITVEDFKLKKDFLKVTCGHNLKDDKFKFELVIIGRNQEYTVQSAETIDNNMTFNISQEFIKAINYYEIYDININVISDDSSFRKKIILNEEKLKLKKMYSNVELLRCYGTILMVQENDRTIQLRKMNILNFRKVSLIKNKIAKVLAKYTRRFIKRPIWLVGENLAQIAQDNGFAFFDYCMKSNKKEKLFYVSQINNKNYSNLEKYKKNILRYDSFKHMYYYELAKYLIVSHGIRDVMPTIFHNEINKNSKDIIYLQHGIISMKKVFFNKSSYNGKIKKFIVTSDREKNILLTQMNFNEEQVAVTGLSRFDNLVDNSNINENKTILVMPTWREWIQNNKSDFINSNFYKGFSTFLRDKKLHQLLEENNIILKFYPHIEIQKRYIDLFTYIHPNIKVVKLGEESVQDLIKESLMMITDYSSVALDFNYLKKPVIFYQNDYEEYMNFRGSFINMETDLPGERCTDENDLMEIVEKYISNDFKYKDQYLSKSKQFYKYSDKNNSERIYNLIK